MEVDLATVFVRGLDRVSDHFNQGSGDLLAIDIHQRHVAEGHFNCPIGGIAGELSFMQSFVDQLRRLDNRELGRGRFREVHQLSNDVAEPLRLVVDQFRRGLLFRVL